MGLDVRRTTVLVAMLLALVLAGATPWVAPPARANGDLAAWCSGVGLQPLPGPEKLRPGISFKAKIVGRDVFRRRFKAEDVRQGDLVVVTLLAILPGNRGWLQIVNLRNGNVVLLKY
jgi:hypothetical protein